MLILDPNSDHKLSLVEMGLHTCIGAQSRFLHTPFQISEICCGLMPVLYSFPL